MKKDTLFDIKNKVYFLTSNDEYLECDQVKDAKLIEDYETKWIKKQDCPLYDYLFEGASFPYQATYYRFLTFPKNQISSSDQIAILDLIRALNNHLDILTIKKHVVVFYDGIDDFCLSDIINTINDDFSLSLKFFESGPLRASHPQDFMKLMDAYLKYSYDHPRQYTTTRDLIFDIVHHEYDALKPIRNVILKELDKDPHLESIIQGMFKNNLNISQTAHDVYMHRNTVMNKIDHIYELTGFSIQNFYDAMALYLLIRAI
ncbi:MAG: helix-turn-helix domain-containing protein [Bacilli bacterium]|jgi:hypothetical protein|nr:helix-turn-helix domain-containing protein [Bacilli bacterium]